MTEAIPLSVRQRFREALAAFQEQHPELSVPDCAREFVTGLMAEDLELVRDLIVQDAQGVVAELLRREIQVTRSSVLTGFDLQSTSGVRVGGRFVSRGSETLYERIEAWREYVPRLGRHSTVMEMRKEDLLSSADRDQQLTDAYAFKMLVKRSLADDLNDEETVGEHFTAEQIHVRLQDIRHRLSTGALRVNLGQTSNRIKLK